MSDQPFYAHRTTSRHLRASGVELQIYQDGEFLQARRWPSRALEETEDQKASYLRHGYVIVESAATAQPVISEPESDVS